MKLTLKIIVVVVITLMCHLSIAADSDYSVPAEFAKQESVWLAWPQFEPVAGHSNIPQMVAIIAAVTPDEVIDLVVNNQQQEKSIRARLSHEGIKLSRVRFHHIPYTDFWMRDVGAIFTKNKQGQRAAVKFGFNEWGMATVSKSFKSAANIDGDISSLMAKEMNIPMLESSLVAEGGTLELNGKGTLITTESVILQPERNPGMTKQRAEAELKRVLGVKKIIWLKQGIAADDSTFNGPKQTPHGPIYTALATNGHTDEFVRWVNEDTVLLAEVTNAEAEQAGKESVTAETRRRLEDAFTILSQSTTADNKKINIIRIPAAEEIYKDLKPGDATFDAVMTLSLAGHQDESVLDRAHQKKASFVSANSYLNFLVTNKTVLMPQYWVKGRSKQMLEKDLAAKRALQKAFPDRKIVAIKNVEDINIGGGGIHCITQQMP